MDITLNELNEYIDNRSQTQIYSILSSGNDINIGSTRLNCGSNNCMWWAGRDHATIRQHNSSSRNYSPVISIRTDNGTWEIGCYDNDYLYFSFISDEAYAVGDNSHLMKQFYIDPNGPTGALNK